MFAGARRDWAARVFVWWAWLGVGVALRAWRRDTGPGAAGAAPRTAGSGARLGACISASTAGGCSASTSDARAAAPASSVPGRNAATASSSWRATRTRNCSSTSRECAARAGERQCEAAVLRCHRSAVLPPSRFTGSVKLKAVIVMGEDDDSHPSELRLFKNIPQMSFDDAAREPEQTFSLNPDPVGELEYPTKIARFSNVHDLSMYFPKNFGAETTKIFYIGLKGEWTEAHRHKVTICNYEASPNPADHRLQQVTPQSHCIS